MPNSTVQLTAEVSQQSLDRISSQLEKAFSQGLGKGLGRSNVDKAFGNMTTAARSFDQTLASVNKRVIGFGLALGVFGTAEKALRGLVSSTREVEASMARLSSVIPLTARQMDQMRKTAFDLARSTGGAFDDATKAIEGFSKVSGSLDQATARARVALQAMKVGGLDVDDAVKGLTASLLTFQKTGEDVASIANKISAATRTFPGGFKDALEAVNKFGAQANSAGVSLNQLLGYIVAIQAKTASGGQSIGTFLERAFARLQTPGNIGKLQGIPGLEVLDDTGRIKQGIALLTELTNKYDQLSAASKRSVAQIIGGAFGSGANNTQTLISDLTRANGLAAQVSKTVAESSNDLASRLVTQTNTLDQSLKNLGTTGKQIGEILGRFTVAPALRNIVGGANLAASLVKAADGEGVGAYIAQGILKGIGNVLSGPGLVLLSRVLVGALKRQIPEVLSDIKVLGGVGGSKSTSIVSSQEESTLRNINTILGQATEQEQARFRAASSVAAQEQIILEILQKQAVVSRGLGVTEGLAFLEGASAETLGRVSRFGGHAAGGYIPAMTAESRAISLGVGGAPASARPVYLPHFATGFGKGIVANTSEFVTPQGAIYNRDMIQRGGLPPGSTPVAAGGFIPNAADGIGPGTLATLRKASPLFQPLTAGQDPIEVFQTSLSRLIKKGFDLSSLNLNQPEAELRKSVRDLIARSLQVSNPNDPEVQRALSTVARATISAQGNRISYYRALQGQEQLSATLNSLPGGDPIRQQAASARIFYGGEQSGSSVFIPPGPGDVPTPRLVREYYASTRRPTAPFTNTPAEIAAQISQRGNAVLYGGVNGPSFVPPRTFGSTDYDRPIGPRTPLFAPRTPGERIEADRLIAAERAARLERFSGRLNQGLLLGTLASGFIPEGQGGTRKGQALGALSYGVQGAGVGGQIGSIFGPEGTLIGAGLGGAGGAIFGAVSKSKQSFDDLAKSLQEADAHAFQLTQSVNQYVNAVNDLEDARTSGGSKTAIAGFAQAQQQALLALPQSAKDKLVAAGTNPDSLADAKGSILSDIIKSQNQRNAVKIIGAYGSGLDSGSEDDAANAFAGLFKPGANVGRLNTEDKRWDLARIGQALSNNTSLSSGQVNSAVEQLSKLDIEGLTSFLAKTAQAYETNQAVLKIADNVQTKALNIGQLKSQIQDEIDFLESAVEGSAGLRQYLTQSTGQRVAAAGRILGSRSIASGRGQLTALDLEGNFRISQAQEEAQVTNSAALNKTRAAFLSKLSGADLDSISNPGELFKGISGASSVDQFHQYLDQLGEKTGKGLDKVVEELAKTYNQSELQVKLVRESVALQKEELKATQRENLVNRGTYNLDSLTRYQSLGTRAAAGGINGLSASLEQSELLDTLGVPSGSKTRAYQDYLRKRLVLNQLAGIASRQLGHSVRPTFETGQNETGGLLQAAAEAGNSGTSSGRSLSERLYLARDLLGFDYNASARKILRGSSDITLRDVQGLTSSGRASLGEAGIIGGISTSNKLLSDISDNISALANGEAPAQTQDGGGSLVYGTDGSGGVLANTKNASSSAHIFLSHRRNRSTYGLADYDFPDDPSFSFTPDKPKGLIGQFGAGFGAGLDQIKRDALTYEDIGSQTAKNLTDSFASFFSSFASGSERGSRAFRQFASSIFAEESKLFATSAFQNLFGSFGPSSGKAMGGYIGLASGGSVPVMLTGGEYVFGPDQARRLGPRALHALNSGGAKGYAVGGLVQGGSGVVDDVPGRLPAGSFVVKKSMVQRYGPAYLDSLAKGSYANRDGGGFLGGGFFGWGALIGGLIGAIADKKNRLQGFLIGAGAGALAGGTLNAVNGGNFFTGATSAAVNASTALTGDPSIDRVIQAAGGGGGSSVSSAATNGSILQATSSAAKPNIFQSVGEKLLTSAALGGASYLFNQPDKVLDTPGIMRNATQIEADQQNYINNRPAGSFVNAVRGPNGTVDLLGYTGPASEYYYSSAGAQPVAAGGYVGGDYGALSSGPAASSSTVATVAPQITIHNYGNGNVSSSVSPGGSGGTNNSLSTPEFADKIHQSVVSIVKEELAQAVRPGGFFQQRQRNVANAYGA